MPVDTKEIIESRLVQDNHGMDDEPTSFSFNNDSVITNVKVGQEEQPSTSILEKKKGELVHKTVSESLDSSDDENNVLVDTDEDSSPKSTCSIPGK